MGGLRGPEGVFRLILPHYSPADLEQIIRWEHPGAQRDENAFADLAELTRAYFNGKKVDFTSIACDMPAPSTLSGKALAVCRRIPHGQTRSYGSIAEEIISPDSARAVAAALGKNSVPLLIPCHRVTYSGGRVGGFSAPGGVELKTRMLNLEKG
jgi:methylated-DNA-[protein]-cysteine S-methyltransferase